LGNSFSFSAIFGGYKKFNSRLVDANQSCENCILEDDELKMKELNIKEPVLRTKKVLAGSNGSFTDLINFPALLEALPIAVYTCNAQGRITFYNKAAAELWGREPEVGKDFWCGSWKIYHTDNQTLMALDECPMARTLKEGRAIEGEEIIVERPDGIRRLIQPHPIPQFDNAGKLAGAVNMLIDITERKEIEKNIASLAAIVQSSDDAIISKTLQGIITSWNNAAERIFGYTSEEIIGKSVTILIPDERIEEETVILARLKKGERIEHFETQRITKDKKILDISLTISPIKDKRGNIIGVSKIARNITSQKLAEKQLHENEERFRMAVEATRLGTWEFYPATGKLEWSDECRKIYDVPEDMKVDYNFFAEHIYPADAAYVQEEIQKAMDPKGEGHYDILYRIVRYRDGEPRWIRAQGKVYFNLYLQPERFIGTVLDVNEEKAREEQLQDNIELFTTMVDNVPVMIWMSGTDKYADFFNKTWLQFTGRTTEQENNEGWLENVHPDDVQKCIDDYNRSFNEQKGCYSEYRLRRKDGEYRWVADNSVPRYDAEGMFTGFISACMDIDDEKKPGKGYWKMNYC
jgi:PAS domain S-box-containing protein